MLPLAVLLAMLLAAINPALVFAEGETPETLPEETPPTETVSMEIDLQGAVEQLADGQAAIVDPNGSTIPLASQTALDVLKDPDPWFYCSVGCTGGRSPFYATINEALAEWVARKGTGMIYLEGGFNQTEDVIINGTIPGFSTLKGIVWDTTIGGTKPVLTGYLEVDYLPYGFKIDGLTIISNDSDGLYLYGNAGAIVLKNTNVVNLTAEGIFIANLAT
jgi:hypothetical protein